VSAFEVLRRYFAERAAFTEADFAFMRERFAPRTLAADEFLQRGGDVPEVGAFVATGCLRSYVIDAKGKEHIVQFAPEGWWLSDTAALASGAASPYFFQAIEPSELMLITPVHHVELLRGVPGYGEAFRTGMQRHAAAKDRRIVTALSATAEEKYREFLELYPSLAQRVPQWMLASYLGLTPETISRVRRKRPRRA
jgi:CRP-like cAMP-binding protein